MQLNHVLDIITQWNMRMRIQSEKAVATSIIDLQDNRSIISGSYDKTTNVYDINSQGKILYNLPVNKTSVTDIFLNRTGKQNDFVRPGRQLECMENYQKQRSSGLNHVLEEDYTQQHDDLLKSLCHPARCHFAGANTERSSYQHRPMRGLQEHQLVRALMLQQKWQQSRERPSLTIRSSSAALQRRMPQDNQQIKRESEQHADPRLNRVWLWNRCKEFFLELGKIQQSQVKANKEKKQNIFKIYIN